MYAYFMDIESMFRCISKRRFFVNYPNIKSIINIAAMSN